MRWHIILSGCWRSSHETPVCVCFCSRYRSSTLRKPSICAADWNHTHGENDKLALDAVLVDHWRCQISEIRPMDYLRMKRDLREEHAQEKAEKAQEKK
jgi:hypothetical protein